MSKYRRIKRKEEANGASGEYPEYGAIFMSNRSTRKECLRRELFGLPMLQAHFVKQVKTGMVLFLFDFETRELHGVFHASSDGAMNIEPDAFSSSRTQFPAQVKFTEMWRCRPLRESEFSHAIRENYFTSTKFNFGLSKAQVQKLLKLFSLKKVERSRKRQSADAKPTRESECNLQNTVGDSGFRNRCAGEADSRVTSTRDRLGHRSTRNRDFGKDRSGIGLEYATTQEKELHLIAGEADSRVTSTRDRLGHRSTRNRDFGDDRSGIGLEYATTRENKYPGETSEACRRLTGPIRHGSKDRLEKSSGSDALTVYSDYSSLDDRRVPKNLRHTESGWSESEYHDKYGITQASSWPNDKEHISFEGDPLVPAQSAVPRELPYGTNTGRYDPCNPGIMADGTKKSSRHDLGVPNVDLMGSASFRAHSDYILKEDITTGGGYVSDSLPSQTIQPYADEHNDTRMNKTSSLGLDDYIPMPIAYPEYQTNVGMFGVACSGFESESRNSHLHHSQFTGLLPSAGATENMRNLERLSDSSHSIFPSFAYPLPRNSSPKDRYTNEIASYQHLEEVGGHASYSNERVVRDSRIYPSFTYPSTSGDGADLYSENRTQNEMRTYHRHEERKSVFSRLAMPSKERDSEKGTFPDNESVDEVMTFLSECHKNWMEQKGPNMSYPRDFGKLKKKKEKVHTREELDNDLMLHLTETTPDDLLDCEERLEHSAQELPFIDFKRRSKVQKSHGNPTQGCQDSPEHVAPQNKKRKLLRPKLIEDDSEKDRGNNDNPNERLLASQLGSEVPVRRDD